MHRRCSAPTGTGLRCSLMARPTSAPPPLPKVASGAPTPAQGPATGATHGRRRRARARSGAGRVHCRAPGRAQGRRRRSWSRDSSGPRRIVDRIGLAHMAATLRAPTIADRHGMSKLPLCPWPGPQASPDSSKIEAQTRRPGPRRGSKTCARHWSAGRRLAALKTVAAPAAAGATRRRGRRRANAADPLPGALGLPHFCL